MDSHDANSDPDEQAHTQPSIDVVYCARCAHPYSVMADRPVDNECRRCGSDTFKLESHDGTLEYHLKRLGRAIRHRLSPWR